MSSDRRVVRRLVTAAAWAWLGCAGPAFSQTVPECGGLLPADVRVPDLVNMIPRHVHVQEAHQRHRLMFTTGIGNIGDGPMELEPATSLTDPRALVTAHQHVYDGPTRDSGVLRCRRSLDDAFTFHPAHNHWHLSGINLFEVRAALDDGSGGDWDATATGSLKEGFCLIDYVKMNGDQLATYGIQLPRRTYWDCAGRQGVSTGWIDYYHHSTHGQYVDITGAPPGVYYLVLTANPNKIFLERDYANNRAWISFRLEYRNRNNAIVTVLYDSLTQAGEGLAPPGNTNR